MAKFVVLGEDDGKGMVWCKCENCHCTNLEYRHNVKNPKGWICAECDYKHPAGRD